MADDKRERFITEYLIDSNATQAAIRAGYSPASAESQGSRLLRNAKVRAAIDAAQAKQTEEAEVTVSYVLERLKKEAEGADMAGARVKALELLGKYLKMFVEKVEVGGADGAPLSIQIIRTVSK